MTLRWHAGMGRASGQILEPHTYIYLYIDSGKNNIFSSFVFTLRSKRAPPGIIHYRVRGTRYRYRYRWKNLGRRPLLGRPPCPVLAPLCVAALSTLYGRGWAVLKHTPCERPSQSELVSASPLMSLVSGHRLAVTFYPSHLPPSLYTASLGCPTGSPGVPGQSALHRYRYPIPAGTAR
jgi:hypothetical protein